ncbi:hypothetical protein HDU97_009285 [Phlyctochytrium planicorne]|nr:hypothetical protein HDU97_009285 [Phlyctochytrium planicorne]
MKTGRGKKRIVSTQAMVKTYLAILAFALGIFLPASVSAYDYPYGASDVSVIETSFTSSCIGLPNAPSCTQQSFVSVNLAVKNRAYVKIVGVRYTNSSWASNYEAFANYKSDLTNGFELWSLTIPTGPSLPTALQPEYTLAAFVSFNNADRVWDPLNNYNVIHKTTPRVPAAFLTDGLSFQYAKNQVLLTGSANTYSSNRAADYKTGKLIVRWSTDGEKFQETSAIPPTDPRGDTWTWSVPVFSGDVNALPPYVVYTLVNKAVTPEFTINNRGAVFFKKINPNFSKGGIGSDNVSGVAVLSYTSQTDLPVIVSFTLDGGIPTKSSSPLAQFAIESGKLTNGKHNVDVVVNVAGGPVLKKESIPFTVLNTVQYKDSWIPPLPYFSVNATSDAAAVFADKIYLGLSSGFVVKYNSYGINSPASVYDAVDPIYRVAVDASSVYALTSTNVVYKFVEKTGKLDAAFGGNGTISVKTDVVVLDGKAICFNSAIAIVGDALFVADACNYRILKFSASTGAYVGNIELENGLVPNTLTAEGQNLIIGQQRFFEDSVIVTIVDTTTNVVTKTSTFAGPSDLLALASLNGHYATTDNFASLSFLSKKSDVIDATWYGYSSNKFTAGRIYYASAILPFSDGTFAVSSRDISVQRFDQTLV